MVLYMREVFMRDQSTAEVDSLMRTVISMKEILFKVCEVEKVH